MKIFITLIVLLFTVPIYTCPLEIPEQEVYFFFTTPQQGNSIITKVNNTVLFPRNKRFKIIYPDIGFGAGTTYNIFYETVSSMFVEITQNRNMYSSEAGEQMLPAEIRVTYPVTSRETSPIRVFLYYRKLPNGLWTLHKEKRISNSNPWDSFNSSGLWSNYPDKATGEASNEDITIFRESLTVTASLFFNYYVLDELSFFGRDAFNPSGAKVGDEYLIAVVPIVTFDQNEHSGSIFVEEYDGRIPLFIENFRLSGSYNNNQYTLCGENGNTYSGEGYFEIVENKIMDCQITKITVKGIMK
jgi:hypothetical protein